MDIDFKTPVDITKEHNAKKPPFPRRAPNLGVRRGKGGFMFRERGTIFSAQITSIFSCAQP